MSPPLAFCKMGLFALQKCLFWLAKVPILERKKGTFGFASGHCCRAKPLI